VKLAPEEEKKAGLALTAGSALRNVMLKSLLLTFDPAYRLERLPAPTWP
jgi:hypothetical protein